MRVLLAVIVKEFLQLRRDRKMIPAMIIGPLVQLLALGYAANNDVTDIPTLLADQDRTPASRALVDRFLGSGYFELAGSVDSVTDIDPWLIRGQAQIAVVIHAGYGEAVAAGRAPRVQVIADGTDSNSAIVGLGYASRILSAAGAEMVRASLRHGAPLAGTAPLEAAPAPAGRVDLRARIWYNPDLRSRWFYLPAVLALVLMLVTMILPSMAVVREKEVGTLEQLIVTPLRPWQLIVAKLFPFAVLGMFDMLLITTLVVFLFGVPLRGSLLLLALLTALFLMTMLGLGLLVSSMVSTQQQAMMSAVFLLMVPMIYLSGLIFPIENMPRPIQIVTYAIPLRYYANVIRGVFLKGSGLAVLWPEALMLAAFGAGVLALASLRFRKSLD
ncbi:MAG TPA: ABC transporter permease [Candidatus Polarisedimenticolia bacterium]|nr:ABC transporter permease [Candidatus Polarisedimenticolia bacterium]